MALLCGRPSTPHTATTSSIPTLGDDSEEPVRSLFGHSIPSKREIFESAEEPQWVRWRLPHDSEDPLQWCSMRKWTIVALVSFQGTLASVASTIPTIAILLLSDSKTTPLTLAASPISFYLLGMGFGPLFLAPLSESVGRRWIWIASSAMFCLLNVGCALSQMHGQSLIALDILRFFSGLAGSVEPGLGSATIGDIYRKEDRGPAQCAYSLGPVIGPALGGVLGGVIYAHTHKPCWLFWVIAIATFVSGVVCIFWLPETYAPVLLRRRKKKLERMHVTRTFRSDYDDVAYQNPLFLSITRPFRLLFGNYICAGLSLAFSIIYGTLYLHMVALYILFEPKLTGEPSEYAALATYSWNGDRAGLQFLGLGVGILIGLVISQLWSNSTYRWWNQKRTDPPALFRCLQMCPKSMTTGHGHTVSDVDSRETCPEGRMFLMQFGVILVPIALVTFAFNARGESAPWIIPLVSGWLLGIGYSIVYVNLQLYLVDVFGRFSASALATLTVTQGIVGLLFTMFGVDIFMRLGYKWGTMLFFFINLLILPLPTLLMVYGPALRAKRFSF